MSSPSEELRRAIQALRELFQLAVSDVELKLGGPLGVEAQKSFRFWLARAYEVGRDSHSATTITPDVVVTYLELKNELYRSRDNATRQHLLNKLDGLWGSMSSSERERVRGHSAR